MPNEGGGANWPDGAAHHANRNRRRAGSRLGESREIEAVGLEDVADAGAVRGAIVDADVIRIILEKAAHQRSNRRPRRSCRQRSAGLRSEARR